MARVHGGERTADVELNAADVDAEGRVVTALRLGERFVEQHRELLPELGLVALGDGRWIRRFPRGDTRLVAEPAAAPVARLALLHLLVAVLANDLGPEDHAFAYSITRTATNDRHVKPQSPNRLACARGV